MQDLDFVLRELIRHKNSPQGRCRVRKSPALSRCSEAGTKRCGNGPQTDQQQVVQLTGIGGLGITEGCQ